MSFSWTSRQYIFVQPGPIPRSFKLSHHCSHNTVNSHKCLQIRNYMLRVFRTVWQFFNKQFFYRFVIGILTLILKSVAQSLKFCALLSWCFPTKNARSFFFFADGCWQLRRMTEVQIWGHETKCKFVLFGWNISKLVVCFHFLSIFICRVCSPLASQIFYSSNIANRTD